MPLNATTTKTRSKAGETSPWNARYTFAGYTDGTSWPQPTPEEHEIDLSVGETFPPVRSCNKGAYWELRYRR
jgi:hypothetical protein